MYVVLVCLEAFRVRENTIEIHILKDQLLNAKPLAAEF